MSLIRNPHARPNQTIAIDDATWATAKAALVAFLNANANKQLVDEASARASHAIFTNDNAWAQMKTEVGCT